jgi:hypothetical protein
VKASHHPRFWFEVALSVASGLLGLVTLVWRDWIEIVFGIDPDHHSGTLEWVIVFALLLIAVIAGVLARSQGVSFVPRLTTTGVVSGRRRHLLHPAAR